MFYEEEEQTKHDKGQKRNEPLILHASDFVAEFKEFADIDIGAKAGTSACVHPNVPLWNDQIKSFYKPCEPAKCTSEEDWVYTANGKFYISSKAEQKFGEINCAYKPVVFDHNDDSKVLDEINPMQNGSLLKSDAFKVLCKAKNGKTYSNIHACISPTAKRDNVFDNKTKYNVLMYGFDSVSRNVFKRFLPNTHEYFTNVLGGKVLNEYNIVGDGTPQALFPILTGRKETEIPEVRRGHDDAKQVDEFLEFIWKRFEKRGYVTQWGEDMAEVGTFTYRMLGFKNKPVNHYIRPFYLEVAKSVKIKHFCHGSKRIHEIFINWLKEGLITNVGRPFFTFGFFSGYSHNTNDCVGLLDEDNVDFLKYMNSLGLLKNTFVLLMSDHGARYGNLRQTEQGKLEERMPYFGIFVPPEFRKEHPNKYIAFLENTKKLVTPFDIYETFMEINEEKNEYKPTDRTSYSLFSNIPMERTCQSAGIEAHWCACLAWKNTSVSENHVINTARESVNMFNEMIGEYSIMCHKLDLKHITRAIKLESNENVLKFKESKDIDGRIADMSAKTKPLQAFYQITMETTPGNGLFEVTSSVDLQSGQVFISKEDISRINKYYDAPKCIVKRKPELRPYCVCKENI
ncbi:hypothetical protein MAR_013585 [Mya arenaria]|uniref:DUF229 domain containing protein n=1 Tax=Mya arenaria TaxID=6604 RepID=A0ABY7G9H0_MYAAR|nr:hypothetical protein MAR_013585 [Mya arenaria]